MPHWLGVQAVSLATLSVLQVVSVNVQMVYASVLAATIVVMKSATVPTNTNWARNRFDNGLTFGNGENGSAISLDLLGLGCKANSSTGSNVMSLGKTFTVKKQKTNKRSTNRCQCLRCIEDRLYKRHKMEKLSQVDIQRDS